MNKNEKLSTIRVIKISALVIAGLTILLGGGYLLLTWNQPLGPEMVLATGTVTPTAADDGEQPPDLVREEPTLTPTSEPICGGPASMNILVTGVASSNYLYGLADAVRVVRVDFTTQEITVLALPRDLWVEIPGLENRGITVGKLNQSYFYGTEGMGYYSGSGSGSGLMAETLYTNYDLWLDHYVSVNLNSFREIINSLGGIEVYLPYDVYKRVNDQPELFLKAGSHTLNGKEAELLARQRIEIGDFGRINNQTILLKALAAKMLSPAGVAALPDLINQLQKNVLTDFSPAEISQLVCLAGEIDFQEDIEFVTLPESLLNETMVFDPSRGTNTAALVGDQAAIQKKLEEFQTGIWP